MIMNTIMNQIIMSQARRLWYQTYQLVNLDYQFAMILDFQKLYKKLAKKGADFFSIPAAFTYTTGKAHWHTLVRARAIENGCFVFASAQNGMHDNGRKTFGHSMIVNPWGKVLAEAKSNDKFIISEINLDEVNLVRRKIPSMTNY